jgi:putative oxidoreductase
MTSIGLEPGLLMATMAGGAEFIGGLLLIVGLLVRPAALMLAVTMVVAIVTVHLPNGLFMANNGYEFGLALLAVSIGLMFRGAGSLSADRLLQAKLAS